jgi:predicted helicase
MGQTVKSLYRPFGKQWLYFSRRFNEMIYQLPQVFPETGEANRAIMVKGNWRGTGQLALMIDALPCYQPDGGGQCFPLKLYGKQEIEGDNDLFSSAGRVGVTVRDAITDSALKHFHAAYHGAEITKEDIFYYVYGVLHSEDYRSRYADNLSKELPRIPCVNTAEGFWAFSHAGRALGELHVNYESVEPHPVTIKQGDLRTAVIKDPEAFYRVTKMKFGGNARDKDKTTVIYNANITMQNVPLEAYDYVVNGKPALEWVMERQVVKTDKASGIVNDANRYAIETVGNPAYPLELFQRVITVSLETMKIVRGLPKLEIDA